VVTGKGKDQVLDSIERGLLKSDLRPEALDIAEVAAETRGAGRTHTTT